MTAREVEQRQRRLLRRIAELAGHRSNVPIPIEKIDPAIRIIEKPLVHRHFEDAAGAADGKESEAAYDLNELERLNLIGIAYLRTGGEHRVADVVIQHQALDAISELERVEEARRLSKRAVGYFSNRLDNLLWSAIAAALGIAIGFYMGQAFSNNAADTPGPNPAAVAPTTQP